MLSTLVAVKASDLVSYRLQFCIGVKLGLYYEGKSTDFENRVLRRISGPKEDEIARGRRKMHNEEFH
jgi:hypothetical protein